MALAEGADSRKAERRAQDLLNAIQDKTGIQDGVVCYITHEVYEGLSIDYRENYHASIFQPAVKADIKAHRRFGEGRKDCFVISPIGQEKSPIRMRADFIFESYIRPACEATNYQAKRSEMIISPTISVEMLKRLEESPMVVVYLGSPKYGGWNPNVMFEVGYRKRCKKPLVILKDKPTDPPFDLRDDRCIDIPEEDKDEPKDEYLSRVQRITDAINGDPGDTEWLHSYPSATIEIGGGAAKITDAMGDLEKLFNVTPVLRRNLQTEILPRIYDYMPSEQVSAFDEEQSKLVGKIMYGANKSVHATVPMFFSEHPTMRGRAFLPVIVSYSSTDVTRLNVIYVEVTGALKKHGDGYFYCDLVGQPLAQPPVADENVIPMKAPAPH